MPAGDGRESSNTCRGTEGEGGENTLEAFLNFSSKNTLRKEKKKILFYVGFFWSKNFDNIQAFFYLIALEKFIKNIKIVFTPNIIYIPLTCTFVKKDINMLNIFFMYLICFPT